LCGERQSPQAIDKKQEKPVAAKGPAKKWVHAAAPSRLPPRLRGEAV
jgi:hypothetical protein